MRKPVVLALGAALLATSASAQGWRDRDDYGRSDRGWSRDRDDRDRGDRGWSRDDHDRGAMRGRGMREDAGPGGGARFFMRSGDARLAVRCDDRDSLRTCFDTALSAFERFKSQAGAAGSSATTGSGATTSPSR